MGLSQRIKQRAKAISHKPELAGRIHLSSSGAQGEAFPDMDSFVGWASVYDSYIWLRKGLRFIADSIKFLPLMVVDADGQEQPGHYISELFEYVNDTDNPVTLWEHYVIYKYLGGEFPLELVPDKRGIPVEVWARRPDRVLVVPDMAPERKLYPRIAGYRYEDDKDHLIPPELLWFDKFTHPTNPWRGLNVISAARQGIAIDTFAHASIKTFLQKGSQPPYAIITPQGITTTEMERIEQKAQHKLGGYENVYRPIMLEEGVTDIKTLSYPDIELRWMEQSRFGRDETGAMIGLPDLLMGYGSEQYDNSDKMNAHLKYYWEMTGGPLVKARDVSMTTFFHQHYPRLLDAKHRIVTDLSGVAVLREDLDGKLDQSLKLFSMGVPFEQINERLELGIDYVPPAPPAPVAVMADSGDKAAEVDRFRRWAKKRMKTGRTIDVSEFASEELSEAVKQAELSDLMKAARIIPEGADEPLPPLPGGNITISDREIQRAIDQWDSTMKGFEGLLDAQSNLSGEEL